MIYTLRVEYSGQSLYWRLQVTRLIWLDGIMWNTARTTFADFRVYVYTSVCNTIICRPVPTETLEIMLSLATLVKHNASSDCLPVRIQRPTLSRSSMKIRFDNSLSSFFSAVSYVWETFTNGTEVMSGIPLKTMVHPSRVCLLRPSKLPLAVLASSSTWPSAWPRWVLHHCRFLVNERGIIVS